MMPKLTAPMFVTVLRAPSDSTGNGVSSPRRCTTGYATLLPDDYTGDVPKGTVLRLARGPTGKPIAVPDDAKESTDKCGPMFGGNFVHTSDSRWPFPGPIAIHDRFDTWAAYNANSD